MQDLFHVEYGEVFNIPLPSREERLRFFEDLILNQAAKAPVSKRETGECFYIVYFHIHFTDWEKRTPLTHSSFLCSAPSAGGATSSPSTSSPSAFCAGTAEARGTGGGHIQGAPSLPAGCH